MDNNIDREIETIKKLIIGTNDVNVLKYLTERLNTLLNKKQSQPNQPVNEQAANNDDEQPPAAPIEITTVNENKIPVKIIGINLCILEDIYVKSEGVKDYMDKCVDYVKREFPKLEEVKQLIKSKVYVQLKVIFEYYHDKPYEPTLKTTKKPFYVDKIIQRSNLVQSEDDLRKIFDTQSNDILRMIHNFEHQSSNWVIMKPLGFKLRFIKYCDRFNRAKGFIPTPSWLHSRKAIINIQNKDDNCFYKCIYRYFNRDKYRHDYRDIPMHMVDKFLLEKGIDKATFDRDITIEALRCFEETTKIGINVFYINKRGHQFTKHDYVSMYNNEEKYEPIINLGYLEEEDKSHFLLISKLNCLISEKYYSHKKLICTRCSTIFSTREALFNHEKSYHSSKELPEIILPEPDKAFLNFDYRP
jgi:hypothetical protein